MTELTAMKNLCTPFAKLDVHKLKTNIKSFADLFERRKITLRPHIKTHKCAEIAKLQLENGAKGITVATIFEAEAMFNQGINDIFLAYPVVGEAALNRYLDLVKNCSISSAVDSVFHLEELLRIAPKFSPLKIMVEIDSGQGRCGAKPNLEAILPVVKFLDQHDGNFILSGVFSHAGQAYKCSNSDQIKKVSYDEQSSVLLAAQIFNENGFACPTVSVGSTPTAIFTDMSGINECRPGNYVFYDSMQVANSTTSFENCALKICARVIGQYPDRIVIDAGSKALGLDKGAHGISLLKGYGQISGYNNLEIISLSEEHGIVPIDNKKDFPKPGSLVEIIPNHSCAAANMFSEYRVFEDQKLIDTWEVIGKR